MPTYTIRVPHLPPITKAPVPMSVVRNRTTAGGYATQANIAAFANGLLGRVAKKVLFSQNIAEDMTQSSVVGTWIWGTYAGHTSPAATRARFEVVMIPGDTGSSPLVPMKVVLTQETGLTGAGSSSTAATLHRSELGSGSRPASWSTSYVDFDIDPDQDYRWTVTALDGARPITCSLYELPIDYVDPASVTGAVDSTLISTQLAVTDESIEDILVCVDKLWRRSGPRLFSKSNPVATSGGIGGGRTTASYANVFDQSVTTVSSTSPGFPVRLQYHHSLDSTDVPVRFWVRGRCVSGSGDVRFFDAAGNTLATITVSGTTTVDYTADAVMNGTNSTDKIDIHFKGDGTHQLEIGSICAWRHAA